MTANKPRYKTVELKTGWPFLACGLVWALYAIMLPLYRVSDFLIVAVLSLVAYLSADQLLPKRQVQVEIKNEPIMTGLATVDEALRIGNDFINEARLLIDPIKNEAIIEKANNLISIFERMLECVRQDPNDVKRLNTFMNYYLPTLCKLLGFYDTLEKQEIEGENITASKEKISNLLDNAKIAFEKQLDNLFTDEALDISTDITVMENMLASQGLANDVLKVRTKENV